MSPARLQELMRSRAQQQTGSVQHTPSKDYDSVDVPRSASPLGGSGGADRKPPSNSVDAAAGQLAIEAMMATISLQIQSSERSASSVMAGLQEQLCDHQAAARATDLHA